MQSSSVFAWIAVVLCVVALSVDDNTASRDELSPGDAVRITVDDAPSLTTEGLLEADGTIQVPDLGRVDLGGLKPVAAEEYLTGRLKHSDDAPQMGSVHVQVVHERSLRVAEIPAAAFNQID